MAKIIDKGTEGHLSEVLLSEVPVCVTDLMDIGKYSKQ